VLAVWKEGDDIEVFESGWVFDHFYPLRPLADEPLQDGDCREGWTMLAALAPA
jgi:hypothetical protein